MLELREMSQDEMVVVDGGFLFPIYVAVKLVQNSNAVAAGTLKPTPYSGGCTGR